MDFVRILRLTNIQLVLRLGLLPDPFCVGMLDRIWDVQLMCMDLPVFLLPHMWEFLVKLSHLVFV